MRLTLRTMLAYLDDLLDADDEEQLAAKIRESDFASGLVHRIRGTVGRARLSSPQVLGKGLAADANTVAEYLDNTLSADRVPDFEKICLESDLHLAEVASCHQILTLVLGEPAAMGPHLRQRIYDLPGRSATNSLATTEPPAASRAHPHRLDSNGATGSEFEDTDLKRTLRADQKHERDGTAAGTRPDYMATSTLNRNLLGVAILFLITATGLGTWYYMSLAGQGKTLAKNPREQSHDPTPQNPGAPASSAEGNFEAFMPPEKAPMEGDLPPLGIESHGPHTAVAPLSEAELPALGPAETPRSQESHSELDASSTTSDIAEGTESLAPSPPAPDLSLESVPNEVPLIASTASSVANTPPSTMTSSEPSMVANGAASNAGHSDTITSQENVPSILYSDATILAHFDPGQGGWARTPSQVPLPSGLRLRATSTFRPRMRLGANLDLQLVSGTELVIDPAPTASITLTEGQLVIGNLATTPETSESLSIGTSTGRFVVTLPTVGTFVAFEASAAAAIGTDPREEVPGTRCHLWVAGGSATITLPNGDQTTFPEGTFVTVQPDGVVGVDSSHAPAWSFTQDLRDIDRQAQAELLALLDPNVTLTESLLAVVRGRRTDVQSVAARVLASLGELSPIIQFLDDPKHHPSWRPFFGELQRAVRHNAESAKQVEAALQKQYPADAELMFRMLWGYSDSQLTNGESTRLVGMLDDSRRMVRVLAFENLVQITGKPGTYRPNMPPSRMRESIRRWQKMLEAGEIGGMPIEVPSEAVMQPR